MSLTFCTQRVSAGRGQFDRAALVYVCHVQQQITGIFIALRKQFMRKLKATVNNSA